MSRNQEQWYPIPSGWCWHVGSEYSSSSKHHPLTVTFREKYPHIEFAAEAERPPVKGVLHPPSYQAGEWRWSEQTEGFAAAVAGSLDGFFGALGQEYTYRSQVDERVINVKMGLPHNKIPKVFYYPADWPSITNNKQSATRESDAALLVRNYGYSLVVVEVQNVVEPDISRRVRVLHNVA